MAKIVTGTDDWEDMDCHCVHGLVPILVPYGVTLGTVQVTDCIIGTNVPLAINRTGKRFLENRDEIRARTGRGDLLVSGQIRFEGDRRDEWRQWEQLEEFAIQIEQEGSAIEAGFPRRARVEVRRAVWDDTRENNVTNTLSWVGYIDTPYVQYSSRIGIQTPDLPVGRGRVGLIPEYLQDQVNQGLKVVEKAQEEARQNGISDDTLRDRGRNNRRVLPAADAYCVATFVTPRLAFTEDDAERYERDEQYWIDNHVDDDDREVWTIDMVDAEDRIDWFMANLDADRAKAMNHRRFRPRSVVDVAHRPAEPVAPATISLVEAP